MDDDRKQTVWEEKAHNVQNKRDFYFNIFKKAFNMKQNIHAINTTILKYAKPEVEWKGKPLKTKLY